MLECQLDLSMLQLTYLFFYTWTYSGYFWDSDILQVMVGQLNFWKAFFLILKITRVTSLL